MTADRPAGSAGIGRETRDSRRPPAPRRDGRPGTVIVVGRDGERLAQVEAALHDLAGWRIRVCAPHELAAVAAEHPLAIVVAVLADAETRRAFRSDHGWARGRAVIALASDPARSWSPELRRLGVSAALPLDATSEELTAATRAVHAGLVVLHPDALAPAPPREARGTSGAPLSAREREILDLMAEGAHNKVIATRLGISRHTVKFHVTSILTKLGAESRTEAVALALRRGLLAV